MELPTRPYGQRFENKQWTPYFDNNMAEHIVITLLILTTSFEISEKRENSKQPKKLNQRDRTRMLMIQGQI